MTYADFLAGKIARAPKTGREVDPDALHPMLHDWQKEIVRWACSVGRAAIWADTGLGKTIMQVSWLDQMTNPFGQGLIVAPLAVCQQTVREAAKIGIDLTYVRAQPARSGLYITNYEMIEHFDPADISAVVLDEASILKQSTGKTRTKLIKHFEDVPYRLSCTATPAPNDPEELTSQAEFLGHMTRSHMLAAYFVHDDEGWRLKRHARFPMYRWMSSWAVAIRTPSDVGGSNEGYILPGLDIIPHFVDAEIEPAEGELFATTLGGVGGRAAARRETLEARCDRVAELVAAEPDEPWLIWCGLNAEADRLTRQLGAINVHGSLSPEEKADGLLGFADGTVQRMITKTGIASQGLNYQRCARMAFVGLSDSYQDYYQAIRRCYRYGQTRIVQAHIVLSEIEREIAINVSRKEGQAAGMMAELVDAMRSARAELVAA